MKFRIAGAAVLVAALVVVLAAQAAPPARQSSDVGNFPTFTTIDPDGSAELIRWDDRIQVHISATGSQPGAPYTMWWVIFNDPEGCEGGCGLDDVLASPRRGGVSQVWAAGHVVSQSGKANFTSVLRQGDVPEPGPGSFGDGLVDVMGAEIHVVTRSHTDQIPGLVDDAIHSFNGGCPPCGNTQMAKFPPLGG